MMGQSAAVPCTSKQCTWNMYKGMLVATVLEGKKISGLEWTRPSYFKKGEVNVPNSEIILQLPQWNFVTSLVCQVGHASFTVCILNYMYEKQIIFCHEHEEMNFDRKSF